jgi:hypothetical protein
MTFQRGTVPKTRPFQFADLAELLILSGEYSEISRADLERIIEEGQPDPDDEEDDAGGRALGPDTDLPVNARDDRWISACVEHFRSRKAAFGKYYPFLFDGRTLQRKETLTETHLVYIFVLCCARLASFPTEDGVRQKAAKAFTTLSAEVMKNMLPKAATVRIFDAGSTDRANYYGNNLRKALVKLAEDLCEPPTLEAIEEQETSGDAGLDLVGLLNLADKSRGHVAMFGQCAAQQNGWPQKTLEASPERMKSLIGFSHPPSNVMFMPLFYRKAAGTWVNQMHAGGCILMDRLRILKLLAANTNSLPVGIRGSINTQLVSLLPQTFC